MFANRYTAFVDACSLADALRRDFLLSLADAEFFRLRWSERVLQETEAAILKMLSDRGFEDAKARAARSCAAMQVAFPEAMIADYEDFEGTGKDLPDPNDVHVLAAALKAQSQTIVTENLRDFPSAVLYPLNMEARSSDDFIADTIALDTGRAIKAVRRMRQRLKQPEKSSDKFLRDCEARGLLSTAAQLKPFIESI